MLQKEKYASSVLTDFLMAIVKDCDRSYSFRQYFWRVSRNGHFDQGFFYERSFYQNFHQKVCFPSKNRFSAVKKSIKRVLSKISLHTGRLFRTLRLSLIVKCENFGLLVMLGLGIDPNYSNANHVKQLRSSATPELAATRFI